MKNSLGLRSLWNNLVPSPLLFGLLLILLWGIPRFVMVLHANKTGNYQWISLIFLSMWIAPWILMTRKGRRQIGIKWPDSWVNTLAGLILGGGCCLIMYGIARWFFDFSISNWFVYVSQSYSNLPDTFSGQDKLTFFIIYSLIGMTFSPIGEELFYRGIVHQCFSNSWGNKTASVIDSLAFSLTHLSHFGIIYYLGQWKFLFFPALLWVSLLFLTCLIFSYSKTRSGSLLGAIMAHAGFNLAMTYLIFYHIL